MEKHILIFVSFELNCRIYQYRKKKTIYEKINKVILVLLSMKKCGLQDWLCITVTIFQIHGIKVKKRRRVIFEKMPNVFETHFVGLSPLLPHNKSI